MYLFGHVNITNLFFENIGPLAAESKEQRGENSDLFVTGQDG